MKNKTFTRIIFSTLTLSCLFVGSLFAQQIDTIPSTTLDRSTWTAIEASSLNEANVHHVLEGAIDDSVETMWFSDWQAEDKSFPMWYTVDFGAPVEVDTIIYQGRLKWSLNGIIKKYEIYLSNNKDDFGDAVKTGEMQWPDTASGMNDEWMKPNVIALDAPATGRYIKIVTLEGVTSAIEGCIQELHVIGEYTGESAINNTKAIDLSVYPNPSAGEFTVVLEQRANVSVKDILGRTVVSDSFETGRNKLDLSGFGSGLYMLVVEEGSNISTYKLQVK